MMSDATKMNDHQPIVIITSEGNKTAEEIITSK